jgi:uncharacterized protein (UPF0335 family)
MTKATIGHNSGDDNISNGEVSSKRLKSIIQRIEKLEEDKAAIAEDIKEVYAEAKGTGFDVKIIRAIIRDRKMDIEKVRERDELIDLYKSALGMLLDTPLGNAAMSKVA